MRQNVNILRGRPWLLLLALFVWLLPQKMAAAPYFVDDPSNYTVSLGGTNIVYFEAPAYDQSGLDMWINEGNLKVSVDGGAEYTIFQWKSPEGTLEHSATTCSTYFKTDTEGFFDITLGNSRSTSRLTKENPGNRTLQRNSDGATYSFSAEWVVPYNLLGKELKFIWDVKRDGNGYTLMTVPGLKTVTIKMPEANAKMTPFVSPAMLNNNNPGKLEVPWYIPADDLVKASYEYDDGYGKHHSVEIKDVKNGTIMLNANEPHRNFCLIVSYNEKGEKGTYLIENQKSDVQNIQMIHAPTGLTLTPSYGNNAKVELKWSIPYKDDEDLTPTDFFQIQRSLTGKEEDFATIFEQYYAKSHKNSVYTYTDSTLVEAIAERMLKDGGTLDNVTYRVRRGITKEWGWDNNNCATTASCVLDKMHLLRIADYTSRWEDERARTVRVSWDYAADRSAVWDERAEMKLLLLSRNRDGEQVDSTVITLNNTERQQRYTTVSVARSCVYYDIKVYVERGASPLPLFDDAKEYFFAIRSEADWEAFRDSVQTAAGKRDINARLYTDISSSNSVGDADSPYCGIFDGNGHTLTINITHDSHCQAPFRYVGSAAFRNLHTAGTINTKAYYAGGLMAYVLNGSKVTIDNCRSSMAINSTNRTNGGFISFLGDNADALIRNSKFDGSFEGAESSCNGGFIGYCQNKSSATIENCVFAPDHITTSHDYCQTWARGNGHTLNIINSYATMEYTQGDGTSYNPYLIYSAADWNTFRDAVETAKNSKEINAILMEDITVNSYVGGGQAAPYRGTFDGNGHTLNVNLYRNDGVAAAPFNFVGDVTIKNLHVTGTVNGGIHSAGLIAERVGSPTITLDRVWVSTEVTTSSTHVAGFLGHAGAANVNMTDVRFDGHLTTNMADWSFAGSFIGWGGEGSWVFHRAYNYEATGQNANKVCFCISSTGGGQHWGSNSYSSLTITSTSWSDWGTTYYNKKDQNEVMNLMNEEQPGSWHLVDGMAVPVLTSTAPTISMSADDLLNRLNNGWTQQDGVLVPVTTVKTLETNPTITTHTAADFKQYYHAANGKIEPTLMTQTRQSSVLLSWNTDGNPIDFYTVLRRNAGQGDDQWVVIATDLDQMSYEDTSVSPLLKYEYKVRAINQCEGRDSTETNVKAGECKPTGRVEGYVRFNDGTGVAGIQVEIDYNGTKVYATTDESGFYEADELSYQGKTSITYSVAPVAKGGVEFSPTGSTVTFDAHSNNVSMNEFTVTNGKRFSGFVMYDGTSIPVKGANFEVDGQKVHSANGKLVETDHEGKFSFRVLPNTNLKIQTVMPGHTFTGDGYYKSPQGYTFTGDVANIYFYDATKVKLTGRVVGGNDQGLKPLMNNLSKNNLGDSLQIVLTLEGDNTSWLVYDNLNPNLTRRDTTYQHRQTKGGEQHKTEVNTTRKRMVIWPDVATGEYEVMLPPVRWKVMQVYCKGYPTLFQEGQVNDIIDLTHCLTATDTTYVGSFEDVDKKVVVDPKLTYNAIYNRIYHSPVEVTYRQMGYDSFDYFGDKAYMATSLDGQQHEVSLAYVTPDDSTHAKYTFGYPVFSMERKYRIQLQVAESYLYNNDARNKPDLVRLDGGYAYMQNGMKGDAYKVPQELDSLGQTIFTVLADQLVTLRTNKPDQMTGENALKTVTFTVLRDGTYYEAKPLQGFVLNMFPVGASQDIMTEGVPILYDILRDPPGAYSTNTLAKGATLNYTYMMNLSATAGLFINFKGGTKLESFTGTVQTINTPASSTGTAGGPINISDTWSSDIDWLVYTANGSKAFSHTMVVGNNISTSGDPGMVGADADLYIGTVQNVVVTPMSTIRAVTDSMFNAMSARLGEQAGLNSEVAKYDEYGTLVKIAEGYDGNRKKFHLIRDVSLGYGPKVNSRFIYSQDQLLKQIIPNKAKEIVDMMFTGTKADAQAIANNTQKPVYLSLREPTDPMFAVVNSKDKLNGHAYNDFIDVAQEGINYLVVIPKGKEPGEFSDEIVEKYQVIKAWTDMIAKNEHDKLHARDLLANYDIAGAAGVNYSETFDVSYSNSFSQHFPVATEVDYFGLGPSVSNVFSALGIAATMVGGIVASLAEMSAWTVPESYVATGTDEDGGLQTQVLFGGNLRQFVIVPVLSYTTIGTDSEAKSYNRTESFTIAADPASHLNVDVYRVGGEYTGKNKVNIANVFVNDNFNQYYDMVKGQMEKTLRGDSIIGPRSFVFRTRGGATQNPWEDKRVTLITDPGSQLDARTLKICNPKIRLDRQSVSGVSVDDAAKFTVYVSNESEKPEATYGKTALQLFAPDKANRQGAKITVNGQPLTTGGMAITVVPGQETELQMEVRAGQGFDYEGLTVGVMSPTDMENAYATTSFDVHFLHEAGGVNIQTPGDKWVMNTESQQDPERGWYIPIIINGFDRHQHNFDHIELQYKESQRGDEYWTNVCSFYCDSTLMASANGVKKMMPENGNIVTEFFGDGWVTEKNYDLRAVLFCRNGSDFLTTPSKIISGVKDTRRPQLFGTPEPKSGLLTVGDNIVFNFSEDIEKNNLSAITNFEVKGEVNNNELAETVSVQFTGQSSIETEAKRNFSGKDLTIDLMVKPDTLAGRDMPLFSHGTNGQKLQLWLTKDFHLKAVVNGEEFVSDSTITKRAFTQVALVIRQEDDSLTFYNGGVQAGKKYHLSEKYTGTGTLIFGRTNELDRNASQYYRGRMMEARLWYAAMNGALIGTTYGSRRLTGYEKDLVDYYPMNEGSGNYAEDKTQGANARLMGASWAIPRGLSLHVDKADNGVALTQNAMNRSAEQDYTLMFWFKTDRDGRGTLLSNGRGLKEDNGAKHQFHIGFEGDRLMYRSNGFATEVPGQWSDGQWHHYAMTVNRSRNVANIYVDKTQVTTFGTDSLGGISGGYPLIGASRYDLVSVTGTVMGQYGTTPLTGNVDELLFFEQALPETLIRTYATKSPQGDEHGLMTFLGFERQERQKDNDIETVPYLYSKKLYLDDNGQPRYQLDPETKLPTSTFVRDYLFEDKMNVVMAHIDQQQAAPVLPYEEVTNLKFGFIGRDNQVLVELYEPAAKLNHRKIYVTLRDIEDKSGNTMASPQTACYYVTSSRLQWLENRLDYTIKYGSGETITLPFYNNSAANHTFTIENHPSWLSFSSYSDVLTPQSLGDVDATVSKDLSIGTYNEIIYLTDEDGISEPLYLNLTVEGDKPAWADTIDSDLLLNSMNISGQVYLFDGLDTDSRDIVGAFDSENVCHGAANISHNALTGQTGLYLTVYDNKDNGRDLTFRLWQYSTGREIVLSTDPAITFKKDAMLGTDTPVRFEGTDNFVQYFSLKQGWNWVSFNVNSEKLSNTKLLLNNTPWSEGDVITDMGSSFTLNYEKDKWVVTGGSNNVPFSSQKAYAIKVGADCSIPVEGPVIKDKKERTINLKQGWNSIGYTPAATLTVEAALSDYYDEAEPGDVIKNKTKFAYFTKTGNSGRWQGSLKYMKPGEGYMLLRKGADATSFIYPYYEPGSNMLEASAPSASRSVGTEMLRTMTVSATVVGVEPEAGDILLACSNGEIVGQAPLTVVQEDSDSPAVPVFYLNIGGNRDVTDEAGAPIYFAIERDGEIVASTGELMTFRADAVVGSPSEPAAINFVKMAHEDEDGKWYTIGGVQLPQKPTRSGLYIFNGKKIENK